EATQDTPDGVRNALDADAPSINGSVEDLDVPIEVSIVEVCRRPERDLVSAGVDRGATTDSDSRSSNRRQDTGWSGGSRPLRRDRLRPERSDSPQQYRQRRPNGQTPDPRPSFQYPRSHLSCPIPRSALIHGMEG